MLMRYSHAAATPSGPNLLHEGHDDRLDDGLPIVGQRRFLKDMTKADIIENLCGPQAGNDDIRYRSRAG